MGHPGRHKANSDPRPGVVAALPAPGARRLPPRAEVSRARGLGRIGARTPWHGGPDHFPGRRFGLCCCQYWAYSCGWRSAAAGWRAGPPRSGSGFPARHSRRPPDGRRIAGTRRPGRSDSRGHRAGPGAVLGCGRDCGMVDTADGRARDSPPERNGLVGSRAARARPTRRPGEPRGGTPCRRCSAARWCRTRARRLAHGDRHRWDGGGVHRRGAGLPPGELAACRCFRSLR